MEKWFYTIILNCDSIRGRGQPGLISKLSEKGNFKILLSSKNMCCVCQMRLKSLVGHNWKYQNNGRGDIYIYRESFTKPCMFKDLILRNKKKQKVETISSGFTDIKNCVNSYL